jgi:two-component sensor histidine kinase
MAANFFPNQHFCEDIKMCNMQTEENLNVSEMSFFGDLFSTAGFTPRWTCGEWSAWQGWTSIFSDLFIFLSYFGIPSALLFFIYKNSPVDLVFKKLIILFVAFIISCGLTHFIEVVLFWKPIYNFSIAIKFITAVVSFTTFITLIHHIPQLLALKTPQQLKEIIVVQTKQLKEQNEILSEEIHERKKIEADLEKSLKLNNELYRENQHRIKNNLQMITNLIYLKSMNKSVADKLDFHDLGQRVKSISKVHDLLMKSGLATHSEAESYLKDMALELVNIHSGTPPEIHLDIENNLVLNSDDLINCGLIFSEFYSNSVEHAFKTNGSPLINVTLKRMGDKVLFILEDNGDGFEIRNIRKGSFGLDLMKSFASNLGGEFIITSSPHGTSARVEWPYKQE